MATPTPVELRDKDLLLISMLAKGYTLPTIAMKLEISFSTIKTRVGTLRKRFRVQNNVQLISECYERRILVPEMGEYAMLAIDKELAGLEEAFVRVTAHIRRLRGVR